MKLSNKTQALQDLIAPAVEACDVDLWGIEFMPQGKRSLLRIYIDKPVDESAEPVINEDGEVRARARYWCSRLCTCNAASWCNAGCS